MFRFSLQGLVSLALAVSAGSCSSERDSQTAAFERNLVGEYLGQQPPGSEVELFAPGFVSTAMSEANSVFAPDGSEFLFAVLPGPGHDVSVFSTHMEDGRWTIPEVPEFLRGVSAIDVAITANGQRFFFCSNRSRTPGGRHLFFSSNRFDPKLAEREQDYQALRKMSRGPGGGFSDVYWVDASVIERAREEFIQVNRDSPASASEGP